MAENFHHDLVEHLHGGHGGCSVCDALRDRLHALEGALRQAEEALCGLWCYEGDGTDAWRCVECGLHQVGDKHHPECDIGRALEAVRRSLDVSPKPGNVDASEERVDAAKVWREWFASVGGNDPWPSAPRAPDGWGMLESAWGIIANAGGGDWTKESAEWQGAAARWRDAYHGVAPSPWPGAASQEPGEGG